MNLRELFLTENACYKAGGKIEPKGIMVHSTGVNNPNLRRYVGPDDGFLGFNPYNNHWNQDRPNGKKVCVHAFIGKLKDGSIATYQTLPWNHRGWHAGGDANNTHISFEICEDDLTDSSYFNAVYREAVELCAYLCRLHNLSEKDIIGHYEGHQKGIASNHSDPGHWFTRHGRSMNTFRSDVLTLLNDSSIPDEQDKRKYYRVQIGAYTIRANAEAQLAKAKKAGFTDAFIRYD
ncbi:MAG TPA: amidase [Clostridiales bacterium]|jgi:N-acetylmuramoyl-L-alanine amidase|nr:amidase [Clostridiales bacterium]